MHSNMIDHYNITIRNMYQNSCLPIYYIVVDSLVARII